MRPVNLIPSEQRRGDRAGSRTAPLAYLVVVSLAALLAAVTAVALTGSQISDRKAEMASLQQEEEELRLRAESLRPFADFHNMRVARTLTVTSLAESRFDWERVMRELSLILPSDVWLSGLTGTVSPTVEVEDGASIPSRESVPGPALQIVGCAEGQEGVAGFVAALQDIDGVTRVGVSTSELPGEGTEAGSGGGGGVGDDCRTRDFIAKFEIVVAFDQVPPPPSATAPTPLPAPSPGAPADPSLADASAQQAAASAETQGQTTEASAAPSSVGG
jgi:Tfp pilus assembly protein PilN